jgi:transcriptional regulator with PAS, ATPase and Fis domain
MHTNSLRLKTCGIRIAITYYMDKFSTIITLSPLVNSSIRHAKLVAGTDMTVLLKGDTGTGKEVFAQAIQQSSKRANTIFLKLNCAALPENLIESELFGHKKGSFTDANNDAMGLLKSADGGTLFLDEINSLPISIQSKLLHFLDSGEFIPIGEVIAQKVDVRIIAATNVDLTTLISANQFRSDLYYRLNAFPINLPCLMDREEDIAPLSLYFFDVFAEKNGGKPPVFSQECIDVLQNYDWPGNIRELKNICERFSVLFAGVEIQPEHLPAEFKRNIHKPKLKHFTLPETGIKLDDLEANLIYQALERTQGNISKSAKLLSISRNTLSYRIQKYGLSTEF